MENQGISPQLKNFVGKIITIEIALLIVAGVIAWLSNLYFGIVLFALGILLSVIGAYLGNPNPHDPEKPEAWSSNHFDGPSAQKIRAQFLFFIKHSAPYYGFENVMFFTGFIAILISLLFLF